MSVYYLVRQARGLTWDASRGRREQSGWQQHAAFIDRLSEDGKILLGGPVGDIDGQHAVLVVRAANEGEVRAMFADDPWMDRILQIESIEPWTLWIGADGLPGSLRWFSYLTSGKRASALHSNQARIHLDASITPRVGSR